MKNNLFIIGNGFDRGHNMITSYNHFKDWLIEEYPESEDIDNFIVTDATLMPKGEMYISDCRASNYCFNKLHY